MTYNALWEKVRMGVSLQFDVDELQQVRELNLFHTRSPQFVGDAPRIAAELLGLTP